MRERLSGARVSGQHGHGLAFQHGHGRDRDRGRDGVSAPLKLANFPSSQDGDLARTICQAWSGLRGQYYSRVKTDTPGQLSQWLAGADWTAIRADTLQLGSDPDYSHLNAALGTVMAGKVASAKTGQAVDRACTAGN